jgi:LAO/AO transport system ATPase
MLDDLLQRFARHDRTALSRLLSFLSRGEHLGTILANLPRPAKPCRVVALTGSGGVGKSTLAGKLIEWLRGRGQTVAVLACDPQSPLTGGALLGDRFRMGSQADDGVFIRSLAAASGRGALAEHLPAMIDLLEAYGFDWLLIETVGAGQGDTAVRALADVVVLLLQPEAGDDLQWEKAGVMEVADVVAVNKADLPGVDQAVAQVKASLALSPVAVPVLAISSRTGAGIGELGEAIAACPLRRRGGEAGRRYLLRLSQELLEKRFVAAEGDARLAALLLGWQRGEMSAQLAAEALLHFLVAGPCAGQ